MSVTEATKERAVGTLPAATTVPIPDAPIQAAPEFAAWDQFADGIRDMWPRIYAKVAPALRDDPHIRQELGRLLIGGLTQQLLEALSADGDHPVFLPHIGLTMNICQPNADTIYKLARITAGGVYRLRGRLGTLPLFRLGQMGPTPDQTGGGVNAMGYFDFATLKLDADGRFDVILSPERPAGYAGDWWQLDPGATTLLIRQVSADWAKEQDPTCSIERLDVPVTRPRSPAEDLERRLVDAPKRASRIANFLVDHVEGLQQDGYVNKLRIFDVSNGAALQGQFYYEGAFSLAEDEALIIESDVPAKCGYSSLILTNDIYETIDWYNNLSSLNGAQVRIDSDGKLRIVVSAKDPGVPNWLDTAGHLSGAVQGRWTDADSHPMPSVRTVKLADVRAALPSDTPQVTREEREQLIRDRRSAFQQRPLW